MGPYRVSCLKCLKLITFHGKYYRNLYELYNYKILFEGFDDLYVCNIIFVCFLLIWPTVTFVQQYDLHDKTYDILDLQFLI